MPRSKILIVFFVASFVISGMAEAVLATDAADTASFIHVFVIAVTCFAWCRADVMERNIPAPVGSAILCGVLPALGVPLHFFRTRNFRSALIATLKAIGVFVVSILLYALTLYVGEYILA